MAGDARAHDRRRHGFRDVVDPASKEPGGFIHGVGVGRHENDLDGPGRIALLDFKAEVVAVDVWQADVQQDHRRSMLVQRRHRFGAIAGKHQCVVIAEHLAHHGQVGGLIVDK
jgi:hypothetical protein